MSDSDSSRRDEQQPQAEVPDIEFRRASKEEFMAAQAQAERAIAERSPLTDDEKQTGWAEDPSSGLRMNRITGEIDDSLFVHVGPSSGR
jgi:hypothetical protein